jgi:hypothetical protein
LLAAVGILFLAGCSSGLLNSAPQEATRSNQLRIVIAGADTSPRTATPNLDEVTYTYKVGAENETEFASGATIPLEAGEDQTITFKAYAEYAEEGENQAVGIKEVTVTVTDAGVISGDAVSGGEAGYTLSVVLNPVVGNGTQGTLSFGSISLGDDDTVSITVYEADGTTALDYNEDGWEDGVYTEESLPADITLATGRYVVKIELTNSTSEVAVY